MRRHLALAVLTAALCGGLASPAAALPFPEGAYRNVELVGHLPEPERAPCRSTSSTTRTAAR